MGNFSRIQNFIAGVQTKSGKDLENYVAMFKDDEQVKDFLRFTYDKLTYVYGIKPQGKGIFIDTNIDTDWIILVRLVEELNVARTNDTFTKNKVLTGDREFGVVLWSILNRKIPMATLGATVINKAIPGLIKEFKIAKAKDLDWDKIVEGDKYYAERKYDGNNIYIINGECYTREGHRVYLPIVEEALKDIPGTIVTECCVGPGKLGERTVTQGMMTKGRKKTISRDEQSQLKFYVIDYLIQGDWDRKECTVGYDERLSYFWSELGYSAQLKEVLRVELDSKDDMKGFLVRELGLGFEGIVIKPIDHYYEYKRSWNWMRHKEAKTADVYVYSFEYGKGKNEGIMGSLLCSCSINGQAITVKVGQGFKEHQRSIRYVEDHYLNKIIEITYNDITPDGSLTIPLFIAERPDKENSNNA